MRRTLHLFAWFLVAAGVAIALAPMVSAFTVTTVPVGANPGPLAVIPQTGELAVSDIFSNDVSIVDRDTNHVSTVPTGALPYAVAVNRATGYTYVANQWGNSVTAIYGYGEGKKRKTYATGGGPIGIAVNAATNRVYVVNNEDGTVTAIDETNGTTATIPVGQRPRGIAVNEATNRIYVANIWDGSVTVIDGATNAPIAAVPVVVWPYDVVVNPLTNKIYVGSGGADGFSVTEIDGATHNTVDIPTMWQPAFLAINTVTNTIYAAGAQGRGYRRDRRCTGNSTVIATPLGPLGFTSLSAIAVNEVTEHLHRRFQFEGICSSSTGLPTN